MNVKKKFPKITHCLLIFKKGITKLFDFPTCLCGGHHHHQEKFTDSSRLETTLL